MKITSAVLIQLGAEIDPADPGRYTIRAHGRSFWFTPSGTPDVWMFAEYGGAPAPARTLAECLALAAQDAYERGRDDAGGDSWLEDNAP